MRTEEAGSMASHISEAVPERERERDAVLMLYSMMLRLISLKQS